MILILSTTFTIFSTQLLLLQLQGIVVGITLDLGPKPLYGGFSGETETEGLDSLDSKCIKYKVVRVNVFLGYIFIHSIF